MGYKEFFLILVGAVQYVWGLISAGGGARNLLCKHMLTLRTFAMQTFFAVAHDLPGDGVFSLPAFSMVFWACCCQINSIEIAPHHAFGSCHIKRSTDGWGSILALGCLWTILPGMLRF